jgi:hypothetical protein
MSAQPYGKIILYVLVAISLLAGCTFGDLAAPVERTIECPDDSFEQAYAKALHAMNAVGRVTGADRRAGYVTGTFHSGVELVVTFDNLPTGGVKVDTKAFMPFGDVIPVNKAVYGSDIADAADKFVEAYKKHSQ